MHPDGQVIRAFGHSAGVEAVIAGRLESGGNDFAIAQGLQRFDGGAQGEHKIQRGFEPVATWSNHWVATEDFRPAIDRFLAEERHSVTHYLSAAREHLPFKTSDPR